MPPSQEKEQLQAVAPKITERQPLPLIPAGGASLRMLALSEGSLIIYLDDRDSQSYELHNGFDSIWDVGKKVKVELSEPGIALFWLGEQKLDIGELNFFQLNTAPGD